MDFAKKSAANAGIAAIYIIDEQGDICFVAGTHFAKKSPFFAIQQLVPLCARLAIRCNGIVTDLLKGVGSGKIKTDCHGERQSFRVMKLLCDG